MGDQEDIRRYVGAQIASADDMLLNAYGTVYKLAAKNICYEATGILLSETEEMLSTKNLLCNLWSILDYCCIIDFCMHHHRKPSPREARNIKIPCLFPGRSRNQDRLDTVFGDLQYQDEEIVNEKIKTFYRLHFLRNTLAHNTIGIIESEDRQPQQVPQVLQSIGVDKAPVAINIRLPKRPWSDDSADDHEVIPLLDLLLSSCKLVEQQRDRMLEQFGKIKFIEKFSFNFTKRKLTLTCTVNGTENSYSKRLQDLHLECYGLEAEYKDQLEEMRTQINLACH